MIEIPEEISVGEHIYRRVTDSESALHLVLADNRGLLFVGFCDPNEDGEYLTVRRARCVIVWGVTGHINALKNGPTNKTKLGDEHTVMVRKSSICALFPGIKGEWHGDNNS